MRRTGGRLARLLLLAAILSGLWVREAHAYLDPGTGSMLVSALLGLLATALFLVRELQYKIRALVARLLGGRQGARERYGIVLYSEGNAYWPTFEPVVQALDELGVGCTYLTSAEDDGGLQYRGRNVQARLIGHGYRAYMALNVLKADVCVLTTPGLDVLQIKRSKGVRHYVHLVHSLSDVRTYRQFSFDYFDTILTSGRHQIPALRELERQRGLKPKDLLETGCASIDRLEARAAREGRTVAHDGVCVLVAPTWGANGLLARFGARVPRVLLEAGLEVILRPHPQSHQSEKDLLAAVGEELAGYPNLSWDGAADGFESLRRADVLVSDLSGVVFDFAFAFAKPVFTVEFEPRTTGYEASDLPGEPWEMTVVDRIGHRIRGDDLARLPERVRAAAGSSELLQSIQRVKEENLFNPGQAGKTSARQIAEIQRRVAGPAAADRGASETAATRESGQERA